LFFAQCRLFYNAFYGQATGSSLPLRVLKSGYCNAVAGAQATALMPVTKMAQKTRQDSRITAQI
jgi:hypothetical protein